MWPSKICLRSSDSNLLSKSKARQTVCLPGCCTIASHEAAHWPPKFIFFVRLNFLFENFISDLNQILDATNLIGANPFVVFGSQRVALIPLCLKLETEIFASEKSYQTSWNYSYHSLGFTKIHHSDSEFLNDAFIEIRPELLAKYNVWLQLDSSWARCTSISFLTVESLETYPNGNNIWL